MLDILVQSRRNKKAAKRFFRKLLKGLRYAPRAIMTDKLKSCGAAKLDCAGSLVRLLTGYIISTGAAGAERVFVSARLPGMPAGASRQIGGRADADVT